MTERVEAPTNFIRQIIERDLAAGLNDGRVVTRFPPEPNGYLHIGHAKSICLNFGLAERYQGQCNLRFDDTNPEKESEEYVRAIQEDVSWLGGRWNGEPRYASDYFDRLYACAVELVRSGKAYVDTQSAEQIAEQRGDFRRPGVDSPHRQRPVAENLTLLEQMRAGAFEDGAAVLRARIDMQSPNMNMRDPVLYRVRKVSHHQTGDAWCIYPMYDFTHPLSDVFEGITHSICTLEFEDHRPLYDWVVDQLEDFLRRQGWLGARSRQYEFARLNLNHTVTSKRKLKQLVDEGHVQGWNDPRMPTISGLRRRGYTAASLRRFCDMVGVSRAGSTVDMSMLEAAIRDDLNVTAPRAMCVLRPLKLVITSWPQGQVEMLEVPNHPQDAQMGTRKVPMVRELYIDREDFQEEANRKYKRLVLGDAVRLRHGYVIRAEQVVRDADGQIVEVHCSHDPVSLGQNPEGYKPRGVIHWVPAAESRPCQVRLYDRLFTEANPDAAEGGFLSVLNPQSLTLLDGARLEPNLSVAPGTGYQFEREGYFCADLDSTEAAPVFNLTVGLRESF